MITMTYKAVDNLQFVLLQLIVHVCEHLAVFILYDLLNELGE